VHDSKKEGRRRQQIATFQASPTSREKGRKLCGVEGEEKNIGDVESSYKESSLGSERGEGYLWGFERRYAWEWRRRGLNLYSDGRKPSEN